MYCISTNSQMVLQEVPAAYISNRIRKSLSQIIWIPIITVTQTVTPLSILLNPHTTTTSFTTITTPDGKNINKTIQLLERKYFPKYCMHNSVLQSGL